MVQNVKKNAKSFVIELRKRGLSYSEIKKQIYIPKSTLSSWLKNIKLPPTYVSRLKKKKITALRVASQKKSASVKEEVANIDRNSVKNIKKISRRELWLMGIMLYWREKPLPGGSAKDTQKGVHFASSDPNLIKFFLKWLREIGRLEEHEISYDIFANEHQKDNIKEVVGYWAKIVEVPESSLPHIYFQKNKRRARGIKGRTRSKKSNLGFLRVKVKASSMLARQISGWIRGVELLLKG